MERDIFKKRRLSSRGSRREIPVHRGPSRLLAGPADGPGPGRLDRWLRRLAAAAAGPAPAAARPGSARPTSPAVAAEPFKNVRRVGPAFGSWFRVMQHLRGRRPRLPGPAPMAR
jgi:hypothetical protein